MKDPTEMQADTVSYDAVEKVLKANHYEKARLVPILQQTQEHYKWLSKDILSYIARKVNLPPARVYGVATFYAHFALKPKGKHIIKLCDGTACHVKGSMGILDALRKKLNLKENATNTDDMLFTVETVSCLGACGLAPVMLVGEAVYGQVKPESVDAIIDAVLESENKEN